MADTIHCDLAIIGTGIAGMAAAVFAANRGMSVAQAGNTGSLAYTTGYFDLLGSIPATDEGGKATPVYEPFKALPELLNAFPQHPYRFVDEAGMREAFTELTDFLTRSGLRYEGGGETNHRLPSPAGTLKRTWFVPATMRPAEEMLAGTKECVIVDFAGLKGFSARQIAANLSPKRANLRGETVRLPGPGGEVYAENVARMLETERGRESFANLLQPLVGNASWLGLPACLGIYRPEDIMDDMERRLGVRIFEIPTMPPGVPGIRIKEAFEEASSGMDLRLFRQQRMVWEDQHDGLYRLRVTGTSVERQVLAKNVLLASGRFLGGGLTGERTGIRETVIGLPVQQPESREDWHRFNYFDQRGHKVHRTGLVCDESLRPLGNDGKPFAQHLHAAGSVLAGADWMRMKCGAGVAVTTALAAVKSMK